MSWSLLIVLFHVVSQCLHSLTSGWCVCIIVSVIQLSDETYALLVSVMTDIQHLKVIRCYWYNSPLQVLTILISTASRIETTLFKKFNDIPIPYQIGYFILIYAFVLKLLNNDLWRDYKGEPLLWRRFGNVIKLSKNYEWCEKLLSNSWKGVPSNFQTTSQKTVLLFLLTFSITYLFPVHCIWYLLGEWAMFGTINL